MKRFSITIIKSHKTLFSTDTAETARRWLDMRWLDIFTVDMHNPFYVIDNLTQQIISTVDEFEAALAKNPIVVKTNYIADDEDEDWAEV